MYTLFTICVCIIATSHGQIILGNESRVINTTEGPVRGYKDLNSGVFVFYNIPYARAPTGTDQFKPPLPPLNRTEIFNAIDRGIVCPQPPIILDPNAENVPLGQQDCLITNIFVPDTEERNLPVLVNIHGGAFEFGNGDYSKPTRLVQTKKIISLTFNYRLGILGFLCLGTEDIPGNAGLRDQIALLRWVKTNIANFGGNPNDITLAGCSAGSASVDLLTVSKAANGLFNKVITGSGSKIASWAVQIDPINNAKIVAQSLNFSNVDDIRALEEFYKTSNYSLFISSSTIGRPNMFTPMTPCLENDVGIERIIDDTPYNILRSGDYARRPTLYGFSNMEGLLMLDFYDRNYMNEHFVDFLMPDLQFNSEEQKEEIARLIREFYFDDQPISDNNILSYLNYFGDNMFAYPMLRSARLHAQAGNNSLYLYEYSFVDENTPVIRETGIRGANHCYQEEAVFDEDETHLTENYRTVKAYIRQMWLDFITTGKPYSENSTIQEWPRPNADRTPYMQLDIRPRLQGQLMRERARFWDAIYARYYRQPVSPSNGNSAYSHLPLVKWIILFTVVNTCWFYV